MVDVKQAISAAMTFAEDYLATKDLLLEEVHSKPGHFEITLSFPHRRVTRTMATPPFSFQRPDDPREYKTFEVDKASGEVEGMAIRSV